MPTTHQSMIEFTGPNYNDNCYTNAHYRRSPETFVLHLTGRNIHVPQRLEALSASGDWEQHPVSFMHYGSREDEKSGRGYVILFTTDGPIQLFGCGLANVVQPQEVFEEVKRMGLTTGNRHNIRAFPKQTE